MRVPQRQRIMLGLRNPLPRVKNQVKNLQNRTHLKMHQKTICLKKTRILTDQPQRKPSLPGRRSQKLPPSQKERTLANQPQRRRSSAVRRREKLARSQRKKGSSEPETLKKANKSQPGHDTPTFTAWKPPPSMIQLRKQAPQLWEMQTDLKLGLSRRTSP